MMHRYPRKMKKLKRKKRATTSMLGHLIMSTIPLMTTHEIALYLFISRVHHGYSVSDDYNCRHTSCSSLFFSFRWTWAESLFDYHTLYTSLIRCLDEIPS